MRLLDILKKKRLLLNSCNISFTKDTDDMNSFFKSLSLKLLSSINQMRSDYDQMHLQYQQYNANVQRHIQELNDQINQLVQTNNLLENEKDAIKQAY
ncbi:unnamed protein product, partial [Rotaria magnacalcarata]